MKNVGLTIILVLGLLLGGSGITLASAQASLPGDSLYALKLWTENIRYSMAGEDAGSKVQLLMEFADQRMTEYQAMAFSEKALENGTKTMYFNDPDVEPKLAMVQMRYFGVVDNALRVATGKTSETETLAALDAIGTTLQSHILKLDRDRINANNKAPDYEPVFDASGEVLEKLETRYSWARGITTGELSVDQLVSALEVQSVLLKQQAQGQGQVSQGQVSQGQTQGQSSQSQSSQGQVSQGQSQGQVSQGQQSQGQKQPLKTTTPQAKKQASGTATKTANGPFGVKSGDTLPAPSYGLGPGETTIYKVTCQASSGTCTRVPYGTAVPNAHYGPGLPPATSGGSSSGSTTGSGSQVSPSKKP